MAGLPKNQMLYKRSYVYTLLFIAALSLLHAPLVLANAAAPLLNSLTFPNVVQTGQTGQGQITFSSDVSVDRLELAVVDGRYMRHDFELEGSSGTFSFSLDCTDYAQRIVLQATLLNEDGARSEPELITFNCGQPPRYDFTQQQAASMPMGQYMRLNVFVLEDQVTSLTQGAQTGQSNWWSAPSPLLIRALEDTILPSLNGIWDQCSVGFELGTVRVLHPDEVSIPQGSFGKLLFSKRGEERYIQHGGRVGAVMKLGREAVAQKLIEEGIAVGGEDVFVFVVGSRIYTSNNGKKLDIEGFGEVNHPTYSIVRWGAIHEQGSEFVMPKQFISSLAHELGHNMGLYHPGTDGLSNTASDSNNLMKGSGVAPEPRANLLPAQCQMVSNQIAQLATQVAADQASADAPATDAPISDGGQGITSVKQPFYTFLLFLTLVLWTSQSGLRRLKQ